MNSEAPRPHGLTPEALNVALSERAPDVWRDACERMTAAVRTRMLTRAHGHADLPALAADLAAVAIGPREVVGLYAHAVDAITVELGTDAPVSPLLMTARLVALEVMGHIADAYRTQLWLADGDA